MESYMRGETWEVSGLLHPEAAIRGTGEVLQYAAYSQIEEKEFRLLCRDVNTAVVEGNVLMEERSGKGEQKKGWNVLLLWERLGQEWKIRRVQAVWNKERKSRSLSVHAVNGTEVFIWEKQICYIEALQSRSYIHCLHKTIAVRTSMQRIGELLSEQFIQIHRSFIVNADAVEAIRRYEVKLSDGTCLPVPEKKYRAVKEQILMRKEVF